MSNETQSINNLEEIKPFKTIKLSIEHIVMEDKKQDFFAYKCSTKSGGRMIDVRFTKACKDPTPPELEKGMSTGKVNIEVYTDDMNIDESREYPILWIKNIKRIIPVEETLAEIRAKSKAKLDEFFGEEDE